MKGRRDGKIREAIPRLAPERGSVSRSASIAE
jgi:hypothetical protein